MPTDPRIYLIAAHPNWRDSRINRRLVESASTVEGLVAKDLWLVASTGGGESSYHPQGYSRYFFDAFLPPYEQTAALCGMRFRQHNLELFEKMHPHHQDRTKLIAVVKQGRQELEEQMAQERAQRQPPQGWDH